MSVSFNNPNDASIVDISSTLENVIHLSGDGGIPVKVSNIELGINPSDAVNVSQVNSFVGGILLKSPVIVSIAIGNRDLNDADDLTSGVVGGIVDEIDGVVMVVGYRVLLNGQSDPIFNGIYQVDSLTPVVLVRSPDMPNGAQCAGYSLFSQSGTNSNTLWNCSNNIDSDTVGVDDIVFIIIQSERGTAPYPSTFHSTILHNSTGNGNNATEIALDAEPNPLRVTKNVGDNTLWTINADGTYLVSVYMFNGTTTLSDGSDFPMYIGDDVYNIIRRDSSHGNVSTLLPFTTGDTISIYSSVLFTGFHHISFLRLSEFH